MERIVAFIVLMLIALPGSAAVDLHFIHYDHLGTPRVVTDDSQAVVWKGHLKPFGQVEVEIESLTLHQRFSGQRFDIESSLHYNYFRDYDPRIGRYIQSDPIGLNGGVNTYEYVLGNPLSYIDPRGTQSDKAAVASAIARGNLQQLRNLLPSLSGESATAVEAAILRLETPASQIIANECKGSILRRFPSEFLGSTLGEINQLARAGNKAARTAKKLLSDSRFKK